MEYSGISYANDGINSKHERNLFNILSRLSIAKQYLIDPLKQLPTPQFTLEGIIKIDITTLILFEEGQDVINDSEYKQCKVGYIGEMAEQNHVITITIGSEEKLYSIVDENHYLEYDKTKSLYEEEIKWCHYNGDISKIYNQIMKKLEYKTLKKSMI